MGTHSTDVLPTTHAHHVGRFPPPPPTSSGPPPPDPLWFQQRLDHFRPSETRTWRQRYFLSKKHYKEGGPTLLMIGGEGPANPAWMGAGSWEEYAKQEGAAMVLLEHRYYGESNQWCGCRQDRPWLIWLPSLSPCGNKRASSVT